MSKIDVSKDIIVVDKMEAGELELRKVFEETTTRNVQAILVHANETRKLLRELEEKVKNLDNLVRSKDEVIETLKKQISNIQQKLYRDGSE